MKLRAVFVCLVLGFAACGTGEEPALEAPPGASPTVEGAIVSFTTPSDGAKVPAGNVAVEVSVDGFEVVNKLGQPPVEGEGHVHFYIDVDEVPTTPGQPAVTDDKTTYHAAATTSHTWMDVKAGEHKLAVQLVNNNHTPLEPPIVDEVTITVE